MNFNFGNFTSLDVFSGLLSLFAAVIGLAYPFILQVRDRIQSRYVLEKVVDWFQHEPYLRRFFTLLKINIPITLLNPYLLYIFRENDSLSITLLTAQSISVCVLLFYLMRLYKLINIYGSYREMAIHTSAEDMERLAIVMLSADHRNEDEGYFTAKDKLYGRMAEILIKEAQKKNGKIVDFPEEVIQIVGKIFYAAEKKRMYPRTSVDTTLIPLLYDAIYNKTHTTKELRKFIWLHLNRLLRAGNTDWLKSYWEWSSQFYRTMRYDSNYNEAERKDFFEMHSFFAAMVLRSNHMELMKFIMTFQNASPEPPCLLLNHANEIVKMIFQYDRARYWSFGLAGNYQMYFFPNDVNADHNIFRVLCDYLAFSLMYQEANKEKYISDIAKYRIDSSLSKEELDQNKSILKWFRETVLTDVRKKHGRFFRKGAFNATNSFLLQIIDLYNQRIATISKDDDISQDKLQTMKEELIAENKKITLPLLKKEMDGDDVKTMPFKATAALQASPGQLLEHHSISSVNFAETLIIYLRHQFYARLASLFLLNGSVRTYLIQYKDLQEALKRMCFNKDEHTLLNNGVSLWNYDLGCIKDEDIIKIGSGNNSLFIVRKKDCPTYIYGTLDDLNGDAHSEGTNTPNISVLDAENGLYWKEPTKDSKLLVDVAQPFVIYNRRHMRYIKINITYDRAIGDCDLHKLKDLREIL